MPYAVRLSKTACKGIMVILPSFTTFNFYLLYTKYFYSLSRSSLNENECHVYLKAVIGDSVT
jgi:hypothetical protein